MGLKVLIDIKDDDTKLTMEGDASTNEINRLVYIMEKLKIDLITNVNIDVSILSIEDKKKDEKKYGK